MEDHSSLKARHKAPTGEHPLTSVPSGWDVLVVGGGNAGFCAAISAAENGARNVALIDKCPEAWAGGNSYFTAGAFRAVHYGLHDLLPLVNNIDEATAKIIDMDPYTEDDFAADLQRVTLGRADADLGRILVEDSNAAIKWLHGHGVRFQLSLNRQAYFVDGRYKFWGGMSLKTEDGGKGLIADHLQAAKQIGITVCFSTAATGLVMDESTGAIDAVAVRGDKINQTVKAKTVILAAGGFEANPRMRTQYLGPGWDLALVRGTPYNTGDCLEIAMRDASAKQTGNWSGCHSVAWDANAPPDGGDREISNEFTKSGYPLGLMINVDGLRFVDEGTDFRNFTYAKFGRAILEQPNGVAFQIFDSRVTPWLREEEYREEIVYRITASSIAELAERLTKHGLQDTSTFVKTINEYNQAVAWHGKEHPDARWDPAVKDGLSTQSQSFGLSIPKSNWALPIDKARFMAVKVGCGITFTFGGLAVNPQNTMVISAQTNREIPGLFCVGEMLGGLFYTNYPGGSGLTSGTVFGRRAGVAAARLLSAMEDHVESREKHPLV